MTELLILLSLGAVSGVLAGLLGIGGGMVLVPVLTFYLPVFGIAPERSVHVAVASASATIVFTAWSSAFAHRRLGNVSMSSVTALAPAWMVGAFVAAHWVARVPSVYLAAFIAAFCAFTAWQLSRPRPDPEGLEPRAQPWWAVAPVGVGIGAIAAAVGIAGGSLVVPYLLWRQLGLKRAIGTSAACGIPVALAAAAGYLMAAPEPGFSTWHQGLIDARIVLPLALGSVLLAPVGARWASRLPVARLKQIFAIYLIAVALSLGAKALSG